MKKDIIKTIRENLSLTKIDVYEGVFDKRTYNKIEEDIFSVSLENIFLISNRFGISYEEILDLANITTDNTTEVDELRKKLAVSLESNDSSTCYDIYNIVRPNRLKNPKYLSLYIALKNFARRINHLIPKISDNDIKDIYSYYTKRLEKQPYLFSQDYNVITNLVPFATFKQLKKFEKFFLNEKLCLTNLRNAKEVAALGFIGNYLDKCLQESDFNTGMRILSFYRKIFKSENSNNPITSRQLWIETLELLLIYKESKELKYFMNATSMLEVLKLMNETFIHDSLSDEINKIMTNSEYESSLNYYNLYLGENSRSTVVNPEKENK